MSYLALSTSQFRSTKRVSRGAVSSESQQQSAHTTSIHILDDDSLLNVFHFYRPNILGEDQDVNIRMQGGGQWTGERWWYGLAQVCQRWRNIILGSSSYLGLNLLCTHGTPVAGMLVHSPPLPLVIDYNNHDITADDEEAVTLALAQRDRVRRIRFAQPVLKLQKLIMAMDGEYPILECLIMWVGHEEKSLVLILPETLQTPHLCHLAIDCSIPIPIRSPLLGTAVGLVVLSLAMDHPSTYFQPTVLLQWLLLMPQLEILRISFYFDIPDHDVERQLTPAPLITHVTLPNLRLFALKAVSAYSEAILSRMTVLRLEIFQICYPKELPSSVPQLLQFMRRTENLRFDRAKFNFYSKQVQVQVNPSEAKMLAAFSINVDCLHLDWQVSFVAQICVGLNQMFTTVEHLTLAHKEHSQSSEEHNEVDHTEWRKLLRSFSNVKTLRIDEGLVRELSRCLALEDGEYSMELLPELQELVYLGSGDANDVFASFIDARKNAGCPVTMIKLY